MASYIFGGENLSDHTKEKISEELKTRTNTKPSIYDNNGVFLVSSGNDIEQDDLIIAFNGYILNNDSTPESFIAEKFREHGEDFIKKINGQFRLIIYDTKEEKFYVSADKTGRKVIYYTQTGDNFHFSSHLKPLISHPDIKPEINPIGISDILQGWSASFGGGERLIKGINRLEPSHIISYDGEKLDKNKFWDVYESKQKISDQEAVERMDKLLTEGAEKLVEQADGELNVFLSGGFDSTFLLALLREVTDRDINTYTWGWKEKHFKSGREMAEKYDTNHHEIQNEYEFPSDEEIEFYEEPQNAFVRYPFYELYKDHGLRSYWTGLNSQATYPVCLKNIRKLDKISFTSKFLNKIKTEKLKHFVSSKVSYKAAKGIEVLESENKSTAAVIDWSISNSDAEKLLSDNLKRETRDLETDLDKKWGLDKKSYQENYNYLQLRNRDTARYAYYSQDMEHFDVYGYTPLVEFAYSLPMSQKKNRRLLQEIAKDRVPDKIINKGASGWDFVSEQFQKTIEENEDEYRRQINDFIERGYVNEDFARKLLLPENFDKGTGRINQMISVYLLERWIKIFID